MREPKPGAGSIQTAILAGYIEPTQTVPNHIGQQMTMRGSSTILYITPEVARQWIQALEPIAEQDQNA